MLGVRLFCTNVLCLHDFFGYRRFCTAEYVFYIFASIVTWILFFCKCSKRDKNKLYKKGEGNGERQIFKRVCNSCGTKLTVDCPKCGNKLTIGSKFCPECGEQLGGPKTCSKCGSQVAGGKKFCPDCGNAM